MATEGTWLQVQSQVNAGVQTLERKLTLQGTEHADVVRIEIEDSYDNMCATANIDVYNPYNILPNDEVYIWQGYNGYYTKTFKGYVDVIDVSEYPSKVTIRCRNILKRAVENFMASEDNDPNSVYKTFNNVQAEAAVAWLLTDSQLTDTDLGTASFTIGDPSRTKDYEWKLNLISAADAIDEVCKLLGWHLWAFLDTVHFQNLDPAPAESSVWTYQDGEGGRIKSLTVTTSDERLRNKVIVFGYNGAKRTQKASSPYLPAGYYKTVVLSSELYDTPEICDWLATRVLNELNRLTSYVNVTTIGNPLLKMGDTITLQIDTLDNLQGLSANYFIYGLKTTMTTSFYTMELNLFRGTSDSGYVPGQTGVLGTPDFTYKITRWSDPFWVLTVDASNQPSSFHGDITQMTVTWDWGDGGPTSTGLRRSHKYDTAGSYTVTMTVTDRVGNTASASKTIQIGQSRGTDQAYVRVLWLATNTLAAVSEDGGDNWYTQDAGVNLLCLACHPTDGNKAWFGGADGKVYYTTNALETGLLSVTVAGDAITALWTDRTDPTQLYCGTTSGKVFYSGDSGLTWTLESAPTGPITYLVTPVSASSVYIGGGSSLSMSISNGASPALVETFDDLVNDGAMQAYGVDIAIATDIGPFFSTDSGASWLQPNVADSVVAVTISAFAYTHAIALKADGTVFVTEGEGQWTSQGNLPASAVGKDLLYDGDLIDIAYGASAVPPNAGALFTWDDGVTWKFLKNTDGDCNAISFGPLVLLAPVVDVYFGVAKAAGDSTGGICHLNRVSQTWEWRNDGLPANPSVLAISSDADNEQLMFCVANNEVYKSTDGGLNWNSTSFVAGLGAGASVVDVYCNDTVAHEVWAAVQFSDYYTSAKGVYRSTDAGSSWAQRGGTTSFFGLTANPYNVVASGSYVYMGLNSWNGGQQWWGYSSNGGASWSYSNPTIDWVGHFHGGFAACARDGSAVAWMWQPVNDDWWVPNISTDGGATWASPPVGRNAYPNQTDYMRAICTFGDGMTIYMACSTSQSIRRSVDGGQTWTQLYVQSKIVPSLWVSSHLRSIMTGRTGDTIYSGGNDGYFGYSLDGGTTWARSNTGLSGAGSALNICHVAEVK